MRRKVSSRFFRLLGGINVSGDDIGLADRTCLNAYVVARLHHKYIKV